MADQSAVFPGTWANKPASALVSSGSGSTQWTDGVVDPTVAPTDTTVTNGYVNTATGTLWIYPKGGSAWAQQV